LNNVFVGPEDRRNRVNEELEHMASGFYGYGDWDAPYWFIGPEQGGGNNLKRSKVWDQFVRTGRAKDGLCDCKEFHKEIEEKRWHFKEPLELQRSWKRLMWLLMAYTDRPSGDESLYNYQCNCWGMRNGETCVIELSGLSFRSFRESANFLSSELDGDAAARFRGFKQKRVNHIIDKIKEVDPKPELVVLYGYTQERFWKQIAEAGLDRDTAKRIGKTIFVFGPHPAAYGTNIDNSKPKWQKLGRSARVLTR
jgi:hypothetical protein